MDFLFMHAKINTNTKIIYKKKKWVVDREGVLGVMKSQERKREKWRDKERERRNKKGRKRDSR